MQGTHIGFVQVGLMEVIEHLEFYLAFIQNLNFGNSNSPPAQSRHRYSQCHDRVHKTIIQEKTKEVK